MQPGTAQSLRFLAGFDVGDLAALVLEDSRLGLWTDFSCFKEDNLISESEDIFFRSGFVAVGEAIYLKVWSSKVVIFSFISHVN